VTEILLLKGAPFFYLGKTQLPVPIYFIFDFLRVKKGLEEVEVGQ
jgi:hypothetical protein